MGNSNSSDAQGADGRTLPKKKKSGMMCACGKGRDDNDEEVGRGDRFGNSQRLTEDEWAAVKTGRLHIERTQPDLVSEAGDGLTPPGPRKKRSGKDRGEKSINVAGDDHEANGRSGGGEPAPPFDESKLRFKMGDRVRCVCTRWGNDFEAGSITKVGYREESWSLSRPTAAYQVKLDKGPFVFAPEDRDEYVRPANEEWAAQLPPGAPWYLQPGALDRELAKVGAYT
uniref:Uncharacterized protein n=1 Tax=Hemiselmis tepida TaxID=464990 RepID=A0A7S0YGY9_9CRYP|mmetsp:Transcript_10197/g.26392  ORF Transcript_10197/g.26392 Transcript_10197/m.26392 type:complete len:227 (+) Transcript_10197:46-726(+)